MNSSNQIKDIRPPKLFEKFLHWSLPTELQEPVIGDLCEEYMQLVTNKPFKANYWYTRQALRTGLQFLTKTKRELIMFLFGILGFVVVVVLAMHFGGDIPMFVNVPSLIIVLPPALIFTVACTSKQSRKDAFNVLLSENTVLDNTELNAAKHVFTTFGNMNMIMGWVGVIIGAIAISSNIESGEFGPAFAVCLLTLFYGLLMKALCYAAESKIQFEIINQG